MIYFIIVFVFLSLYAVLSWRYFRYGFFFLIFYFPFQIVLNPPIAGIDIATGRLMIIILFFICVIKFFNLTKESRIQLLAKIKKDKIGWLLLAFLFFSALSVLWSENWIWGLRKWLVFASILPFYWVTLYALFTESDGGKYSLRIAVTSKSTIFFMSLSAFLAAISALVQFFGQFIWNGDAVFHFWARNFFPVFLGQEFGATVFRYQSWFADISGKTIMRAVGFFPDPHTFGFYIGLTAPLALSGIFNFLFKNKIIYWAGILFLFAATFLTFSRSAYFGLAAGVFIFFILWFKKNKAKKKSVIFALIFMAIILSGALYPPVHYRFYSIFNVKEISNAGRLKNWREALSVIEKYPLYGSGIGSYQLNLNEKEEKLNNLKRKDIFSGAVAYWFYDNKSGDYFGDNYRTPTYAHNLYLDIWAEMGIIGLLLWIGIFAVMFWESAKILFGGIIIDKLNTAYLIGTMAALFWFIVQSFFDTAIYSPIVLPVLMTVLAINTFLTLNAKQRV